MATDQREIQKMFERMDANQFAAPSARSVVPPSSPDGFDSMFERLDRKSRPDDYGAMFDRMAQGHKPAVVFNENADFDAPLPSAVEDFKPVAFTPFQNSDMSIPARLAAGAAKFGGADNPATRSPQTDPDLYGKPVTLSLKS